jgi:hypothetical protein
MTRIAFLYNTASFFLSVSYSPFQFYCTTYTNRSNLFNKHSRVLAYILFMFHIYGFIPMFWNYVLMLSCFDILTSLLNQNLKYILSALNLDH